MRSTNHEWAKAAKSVREDVIVLCHGGPIATPEDEYILANCPDCHGFYGASSMERLPTEVALTATTQKFKSITRCFLLYILPTPGAYLGVFIFLATKVTSLFLVNRMPFA